MYIVKNKTSNVSELIGSLTKVAKFTGLKYSTLAQRFCRVLVTKNNDGSLTKFKRTTYLDARWEIERKEVIKSKRQ